MDPDQELLDEDFDYDPSLEELNTSPEWETDDDD